MLIGGFNNDVQLRDGAKYESGKASYGKMLKERPLPMR
jgi:hypothetical protein